MNTNATHAGPLFEKLVELMHTLRKKCPWDAQQTIESLQKYTLEEVYELLDAIKNDDMPAVKEELGDLLFHLIFYARIAEEDNAFTLNDVIKNVHAKLTNRHPHVFGKAKINTADEVRQNWEKLKRREGKTSALDGVPNALPAVIKAFRIQEKAKQTGFDWENARQVADKANEEWAELQDAVNQGDKEKVEDELGDVLFSIINYARFLHIDPEAALEKTNRKFIKRFWHMEAECTRRGTALSALTLTQQETLWQNAKKHKQ